MKIQKSKLLERLLHEGETEPEVTLADIDPVTDANSEIVAGLQGSIAEMSDDEKTIKPEVAAKAAAQIKATADALSVGTVMFNDTVAGGDRGEEVFITNRLTEALDSSLAAAVRFKKRGEIARSNVLITGLPGSGKTSIVYDWARHQSNPEIFLFNINTAGEDLALAVSGGVARDMSDAKTNRLTKLRSDFLDVIDKHENVVLYLDEFNRGLPDNRSALMQLVNDHILADNDSSNPGGVRKFDNLLFTIATINPGGLRIDKSAKPLSPPEHDRFINHVNNFDSDPAIAIPYYEIAYNNKIKALRHKNLPVQDYLDTLEEYLRIQDIALYMLNQTTWAFTDEEGAEQAADEQKTILSQRGMTSALDNLQGRKEPFIKWVKNSSGYLETTKDMILAVLDKYTEPSFLDLVKKKEEELKVKLLPDNVKKALEDKDSQQKEDTGIEDDLDFDKPVTTKIKSGEEVVSSINDMLSNW